MRLMSSYIRESDEIGVGVSPESNAILGMLYKRYAEEVLQWYHYWTVAGFLCGEERPGIENKFYEFADDELNDHASKLLKRIDELGGNIEAVKDINMLKSLSECDYMLPMKPYNTTQLVIMNIEHEKCAIKGYRELCELSRGIDPVTYDIAVEILKDEEEHLNELENFLADSKLRH